MRNLFIFGYGFSSVAIASAARPSFDHITGTSRSDAKFEQMTLDGITPTLFDGTSLHTDLALKLKEATHIVISIAPSEVSDPVLNVCRKAIAKSKNLEWIGYLSTVGVYGNHDGAWVDEKTTCKPVSKRSKERIAAENAWHEFATEQNIALAIFRLSGIYGPGRNAFINIEKGKARRLIKKDQVFNRIHRDDIGKAVNLAMANNIAGIFNITDDEPAPPQDVVTFAHKLVGKAPPDEIDFETADLTPMARSFYGENKRVSNTKSKQVLGMEYDWPNYRESLNRMWEEESWR